MTDLISRSALIAALEAYKMSMGDIILRLIVDRCINVVKQTEPVPPGEVWGRIVSMVAGTTRQQMELQQEASDESL